MAILINKHMKTNQLILLGAMAIAIFSMTNCKEKTENTAQTETVEPIIDKGTLEDEAWHMEELYWQYVQNNDTITYKTLWHDNFIGYPSFGDGVANNSKIASWIPKLHEDENQKFSYQLSKKASNAIDDVVIVFYDADEIWTDQTTNETRRATFKFTHTWKKYGDQWLILGGMAAAK